jgi:hypothetical protein
MAELIRRRQDLLGAIPHELVEETGFSRVEALGVEGFFEPEKFVIEMVVHFV